MNMTRQTERQKDVSQSLRIGIHKNCRPFRRGGIAKTSTIVAVPASKNANSPWQRNGPTLASVGSSGDSGQVDGGFFVVDRTPSASIEFGKADDQIHQAAAPVAWPGTSYIAEQQDLGPEVVGDHGQSGQPIGTGRPVPSEEFTAPQIQKIFRTAYRITKNREDAEDAMQDACLQAIAHFQDFDGRSKFSTWLMRIAINSSLMILRKRRHAKTFSLDSAADSEESKAIQEVSDPAPGAEKSYLKKERDTALRNEIQALRPTLRGVMELAHLGDWSVREIAERLGLSVATVKARLFHGRRTLSNSRRLRRFRNGQPTDNKFGVRTLRPHPQDAY